MHLSPLQITAPSFVLNIAWVRQAAVHAGSLQCIHCFFRYASPFEVLNAFTTVLCDSSVFRITPASGVPTGSGSPFASAQEDSQVWQPTQRVESYRTPENSILFSVFGTAVNSFPMASVTPVTPSTLKKFLRPKLITLC